MKWGCYGVGECCDELEGLLRNQVPSAAAWTPALFAFPGVGAGAKVEEKRNN